MRFAPVAAALAWAVAAHAAELTPKSAPAGGRPKVAIVVAPIDAEAKKELGRLDRLAEVAVEKAGRFEVVRLVDALDREASRGRQQKGDEAAKAMADAQAAYDNLDTQKAAGLFNDAVKAFKLSDLTRTFDQMTQAWLMKIASLVGNGENKAAQGEIDRLVPLAPDLKFTTNFFSPDAIAHAAEVKKQAASAKGTLDVKTTPPGAQLFLDGQFRGLTPVKLDDVPVAQHQLALLLPGYSLYPTDAYPNSGVVEATLRPAEAVERYNSTIALIAKDPSGALRDAGAKDFGAFIGADQVFLVVAKKSSAGQKLEATVIRLETRDGHNAGYATATLPMGDAMAAAAEPVFASVANKDDPRKGGPVTHFEKKGGGSGKKVAGYVMMGTGAALLGGGLFFGLQANSANKTYRETPQTNTANSARYLNEGKSYALTADVLLIGGLVLGGTGGYLAFSGGGGGDSSAAAPPKEKEKEKEKPRNAKKEELPMPPPPSGMKKTPPKEDAPATPKEKEKDKKDKRREEEERKKAEEEAKKQAEEEAKKKKEDEEKKKAEEEAKKKKEEEEKKKAEEEAKKKKEEEEKKRKAEEEKKKKKKVEEEDLRNF